MEIVIGGVVVVSMGAKTEKNPVLFIIDTCPMFGLEALFVLPLSLLNSPGKKPKFLIALDPSPTPTPMPTPTQTPTPTSTV